MRLDADLQNFRDKNYVLGLLFLIYVQPATSRFVDVVFFKNSADCDKKNAKIVLLKITLNASP